MNIAINILQDLLLPELEKDPNFDANKLNVAFWSNFSAAILDFEKEAKPLYAAIYGLQLKDPETVISKLDDLYQALIKELAEAHVLGLDSKAIEYLLFSKNDIFEREVLFLTNLQKAIKKIERKRIKQDLPNAFDRLTFELADDEIELAVKKKERQALREKMTVWNQELVTPDEIMVKSIGQAGETKIISLSWIKYAVAACFVMAFGVWLFTNQNVTDNNNFAAKPSQEKNLSTTGVNTAYPNGKLAEVTISTKLLDVNESTGLGYTSKTQEIKVKEQQQQNRIISISKAIEKYRKELEKTFLADEVSSKTLIKTNSSKLPQNLQTILDNKPLITILNSRIVALQNELNFLKEREKQYLFDGRVLTIYVSKIATKNRILLFEDSYYLKGETAFYKLTISKKPETYQKINDNTLLSKLNEILFYNSY